MMLGFLAPPPHTGLVIHEHELTIYLFDVVRVDVESRPELFVLLAGQRGQA